MFVDLDLNELRKGIDRIDDEMLKLFVERMELCARVAEYKKANNVAVLQSGREDEILERVRGAAPDWLKYEASVFFKSIMQISKLAQNKIIAPPDDVLTSPPAPVSVSVIIAAAGASSRLNGINKQFALLGGVPVIARSMLLFEGIEEVAEIIVAARGDDIDEIKTLASRYGVKKLAAVTTGGRTRQESVFGAFAAAAKETRYLAVHDGARPLASPEVFKQCLKDATVFGGAVPGVPVKDTLKTADDGIVTDTPDRGRIYAIQTPQVFRRDLYVKGINFAKEHGLDFTDDCQLAEAVGVKVCVTASDYRNVKITTMEDLTFAEAML
jgi:2-C-methyl-D-erythritol 4-phosphate cytidylyltransferase/monofunctional chorismate mutase